MGAPRGKQGSGWFCRPLSAEPRSDLPGPRGSGRAVVAAGRGSAACSRSDPALHPVRSVLGPQRRKLLAAGEEAFTRWFPASLGKPPEDPLLRTAHLAGSWDSVLGVTRPPAPPGAHSRGAVGSIPQAECAQKLFHKSLDATQ